MKFVKIVCFGILLALGLSSNGQNSSPTKGKDFWLGFMKNHEITTGESLDLFIVSDQPTSGTVTIAGQSWSQPFNVIPNTITTVTVPNNVGEVLTSGSIQAKGIHIETQDTVAVFAINFNPYTADGTKILPTPTLGTNYVVAAYAGFSPWDSEMLIVATEDDTEVEIIPSCDLLNFAPGDDDDFIVTLQAGEVYQVIAQAGQDLTGTLVKATENSGSCRPFAVFSGAGCANIPSGCANCDHIFEQNLPVESWGTEYYVTPFVFSVASGINVAQANYTYRILAQEDNTVVSVDGSVSYNLNAGQFQELQYVTGAHCVTSNKPISVIQYMEGIECGGNGDPSMVILDDAEKKINDITFSTVNSTVITDHFVNIIVRTEDISTVTFDGNPISPTSFQSFPNCVSHMWVGFAVLEGTHVLTAPNGVNGYVYGNGNSESYAYSVGSFKPEPPIEFQDAICANNAVQLAVSNEYFNPTWYNVQDLNTPVFSGYVYDISAPIESAIYVAIANETISGCEQEFYFSVEDVNPPVISVEPPSESICRYESVQLNVIQASPQATYNFSWSPSQGLSDPTIANPIATPYSTTTYTVTVSTPTGCASSTSSTTINVSPGNVSSMEVFSDDPFICDGETVQIETNIESVIWSDNFDPNISLGDWTSIQNGTASSACGSVSGTALYFNGSGPRNATTLPLDVSNGGTIYFSIKIADGIAPCDNAEPGDNVELRYSLDGVSFPAGNTIMVLYESAYPEFTQVSANIPAAAQSNATYFRWMQVGAWVGNQDNWSLDEVYVGTFNDANFDVAWSSSTSLDLTDELAPIASPTTTTNYILSLTDNSSGCVYEDSVLVVVATPFSLGLPATLTQCETSALILNAAPSLTDTFTFLWNADDGSLTNSPIPQPVVNPSGTTTYSVEVTSSEGCMESASVEVLISSISDVSIVLNDIPYCESADLTASSSITGNAANASYQWSGQNITGNSDLAQVDFQTSVSGALDLEVVELLTGCVYSATQNIEVMATPVVTISPDVISSCDVQNLPIEATSNFVGTLDWEWTPSSAVLDANAPSTLIAANESTLLSVSATNSAGCVGTAEINIDVLTAATDLGPDQNKCVGESAVLDTGWPNTFSFQWDHGPQSSSVLITQSGVYHVVVTTPEGCVSEDEIEVTFHDIPTVQLGFDLAGCEGESITLDAGNPGLMFNWSTGEQTQVIQVTEEDDYEVIVSNGFCESQDDITVYFNALPTDPFDDEPIAFCFSLPPYIVRLDAQNDGYTYVWDDGNEGQIYNANQPGIYTVDISTDLGCHQEFSAIIVEDCPGSMYAPNAFTPDGDGLNDVWVVEGFNVHSYNLRIWNRWGELMFESNSLKRPWLGQRRDGDEYVEAGVYVYRITYTYDLGEGGISEEFELNGQVTLIR